MSAAFKSLLGIKDKAKDAVRISNSACKTLGPFGRPLHTLCLELQNSYWHKDKVVYACNCSFLILCCYCQVKNGVAKGSTALKKRPSFSKSSFSGNPPEGKHT